MADTTTRYGFPFQEAGDPPDGADLGQDLAEAVDTALGTVEDAADTRLDQLEVRATALETRTTITSAASNASATSGTTELIVDQVTINGINGKTYRIEWSLSFTGTVTDDRFFLILRAGATTGGTQLKFATVEINNQFDAVVVAYWTAAATTPQTFSATARRTTGTGTLTASGAATNVRTLTVEQMD